MDGANGATTATDTGVAVSFWVGQKYRQSIHDCKRILTVYAPYKYLNVNSIDMKIRGIEGVCNSPDSDVSLFTTILAFVEWTGHCSNISYDFLTLKRWATIRACGADDSPPVSVVCLTGEDGRFYISSPLQSWVTDYLPISTTDNVCGASNR